MKRIVIICGFFLFLITILPAQEAGVPDSSRHSANVSFGIKGGGNLPRLSYSNPALKAYDADTYAKGLFGIFAEIGLDRRNTFSLRPEINFLSRGQRIDDGNVYYEMNAKYTDFQLSLLYTFLPESAVRPYLLVAPSVGFARGGEIRLDEYSVDISDANLKKTTAGVSLGGGVKFPVRANEQHLFTIGLEAAYYIGLSDTYSDREKEGVSVALNTPFYELKGDRKHRGLQAAVTVSVPLSVFKKKSKKPAPVYVPQPVIVAEPEPEPVPEPEKECYTLEEMKKLIADGKNIEGKKICAIDLITFETNRSDLDKASRDYLDEVVGLMKQSLTMQIKVNGHTDNKGTPEYNLELSRRRAEAVYNYMVSRGIGSSRLSYEYFGLTRPIATNETEEGRRVNRRVEFEIINQ